MRLLLSGPQVIAADSRATQRPPIILRCSDTGGVGATSRPVVGAVTSQNPLSKFCQRRVRKGQAQSRSIVKRQPAIANIRRVFEQFGLQGISLRIGKCLYNATSWRRCYQLCMDETIMMRRDLYVIQFARCSQLATFGETAKHRTIELQNLNCLLFEQCTAAIACYLALAGRERNVCPQ